MLLVRIGESGRLVVNLKRFRRVMFARATDLANGDLLCGWSEQPQPTLDVAGTIRAQRFLIAKPKTSDDGRFWTLQASKGTSGGRF